MSNKEKILELISQGKTYDEVKKLTGVAKGTISYHCQRAGLSRSKLTAEQFKLREITRIRIAKQAIKIKAVAHLGGKCCKCGYFKCLKALDFHHLDPTQKEFQISKSTSWKKAKEELKKCILVCKNCHAELHDL